MNGDMVSGSSGATAPSAFQFFVRPALTDEARSAESVRLNRITMELASWGQSSVVELSRYNPALGSQKTSLNLDLRAVALADQDLDSEVLFR